MCGAPSVSYVLFCLNSHCHRYNQVQVFILLRINCFVTEETGYVQMACCVGGSL